MKTIYIGAYLLPDNIKNRNTNAAVGALFKTIMIGFKNNCIFLNVPANNPIINASNKLDKNPISVLRAVHNIDIYMVLYD